MEKQKVTLKEVILAFIASTEPSVNAATSNHIYYADENAVWVVDGITHDADSSSRYAFRCHVDSIYGNGIDKSGERYEYGVIDHFIFDKDDEFFFDIGDAYIKRAEILEDIISKSEWIKKDEI